jgi:hypothetical protein
MREFYRQTRMIRKKWISSIPPVMVDMREFLPGSPRAS